MTVQQKEHSNQDQAQLNLITLTFTDPNLEEAFERTWCHRQLTLDIYGCCTSLLQLFAGVAFILVHKLPVVAVLTAGSGILHLLHAGLLHSKTICYCKYRTRIVVALLAMFRILTALQLHTVAAGDSASTRLMYKTGLIPLAWYSIILPLLFRHQLMAQVAAVLLYQIFSAIPACQELALDPQLMPLLQRVWGAAKSGLLFFAQVQGIKTLRSPQEAAAAAAAGGFSQEAAAAAGFSQQVAAAGLGQVGLQDALAGGQVEEPMLVCWSTISFLLLLIGIILPGPVWYLLELRSRARFFKQQQQKRQLSYSSSGSSIRTTRSFGSSSVGSSSSSSNLSTVLLEGVGAAEAAAAATAATAAPDADLFNGGDSDDEDDDHDPFHVPLSALVLVVAAAGACSYLALLNYGPYLLDVLMGQQQ